MFNKFTSSALALALGAVALTGCQDKAAGGAGGASGSMSIVGSSTVFPFAKVVAEQFGKTGSFKTPVLESTGTGGGIEQFCAGIGGDTPSIANASRRMKASELETCTKNGVTEVVEVVVGIDGIALAQADGGMKINLTAKQVYEAVAANPYGKPNTTKTWADVDPSLPAKPIAVYGPPKSSGTRDAFAELILEAGCKTDATTKALKDSDGDKYEAFCHDVRTDGLYIEQGENDNLIVSKLTKNPDHIGVFGYSYMEENAGKVHGIALDGVVPTYDTIAAGDYPGARKLYIYVKKAHVGKIAGLAEFVSMFVDLGAADGPLSKIGLIALPEADRTVQVEAAKSMKPLSAADLK